MADDVAGHGQPTPPRSTEEETSNEHTQGALSSHPYTPPRTHPPQHFTYGDPSDFELTPHESYYEHADLYDTPVYRHHSTPAPMGSGMKTRSGRSISSPITTTGGSSIQKSKQSKSKKPKSGKKAKTEIMPIDEPLSIMTKDFDVPVMDMMAWANRPHEDRYKDVDQKHKGKIPRPMNSFMLYRTAYKERIKKWGQQGDNNQLISKVAGLSWPMEPVELRDFYAKCANVERDNHAKAFPRYKFAPNKNPKKRQRDEDDDESDPEWTESSSFGSKRRRRRTDQDVSRSLSTTPAPLVMHMAPYHHPPSLQASNTRIPPPVMHFDAWGRAVQYAPIYPPRVGYRYSPHPHEIPFAHEASLPSNYGSHLVGMPPLYSAEVLLGSHSIAEAETIIDPGLGDFDPNLNFQYGSYAPKPHNVALSRPHEEHFDADIGSVAHPGMQMLTATDVAWPQQYQVGNDFDAEFNQWEGV